MAKIIPKRTTLLQKLAYILKPFVVYMVVKTVIMFLLAVVIPSLPIAGIAEWVEHNSQQLSAVVNGVASVAAAVFLLNVFLVEASTTGEIDIDQSIPGQFVSFVKTDLTGARTVRKAVGLVLCVLLGITASLALNILVELASAAMGGSKTQILDSEKYEVVESIQYSVPVWLGIVLYGIISPIVEEMVFRGVLYSRIKKFYSVTKAVVFSALLFGAFHANLPQVLYGAAMGVLIALCYEYAGCFAAPVLMHMSANIFIFLISGLTAWTAFLITPVWFVFFAALSAGLLWGIVQCFHAISPSAQ